MRILVIADARAVHTQRFMRALKGEGAEAALASLEEGQNIDYRFNRPSGVGFIDYSLAGFQLRKIVREFNPDLINPHYATGYGYISALSGINDKPIIVHCLGSDILVDPGKSIFQGIRAKYVLKKQPHIAVDSEYLGERAKSLFSGVHYRVIYWGADESAFEVFRHLDLSKKNFDLPIRVLIPRPHKPVYNNEFIIKALKGLINERKVSLTFPDWGEDAGSFKALVGNLCPEGEVGYYGFQSRESFNRMLGKYDVYLSASKSDSSPASLIEAMASGLFPVAGDIPGVQEWLDGNSGIRFDLKYPESLRKGMSDLIEGKLDIASILRRNNEKARREGNFRENIRMTLRLFDRYIRNGQW